MVFSEVAKITNGKILSLHQDLPISSLVLDSRKSVIADGALFFAIKGERHNGHEYVETLYRTGIRNFIVEEAPTALHKYPEGNFILVPSSIKALQALVAHHRRRFSIPVIGITGSNGKTIIKEWLYQILSKKEIVVKNPGSYNSQIGVPLSVWQLQNHHKVGIFEAGISKKGEMEALHKIIDPTIGIFTNIGPAHNEGFSNLEEKVEEKIRLFSGVETLIYCKDQKIADRVISKNALPSLTWGFHHNADIVINKNENIYSFQWKDKQFKVRFPFADFASIENCFHVIVTLLLFNFSEEEIQDGIDGLKTVPMRLELKDGINQCQIIDDTYNNDLAGIEISLQFLANQRQKKNKTLILSDVLESGLPEKEMIHQIKELIAKYSIKKFIGIGSSLKSNERSFQSGSLFFENTDDFLKEFDTDLLRNEVILIKGARVFQFEKIVRKLQRKVHGTVMEVDLGALIHNFNFFKSKLHKDTRVMVMVKAFAYGSGSNEIANILQYHQADYLGVAYPDEGVELRKNNISLPIMVMNPSPESFSQLIDFNLEPEMYSLKILREFVKFLDGKASRVHIKLDTGMHRLGFEDSTLESLIEILEANRNVEVASIFSHLAGADEGEHDDFSNYQVEKFINQATKISQRLGYKPLYHILNSPGILRLPQHQFDMVRLGIGLYGINPTSTDFPLKPVTTLKTIISQIKRIEPGETIGYGRRGKAESHMTVATIAIGYADGFSRAFSRGVGKVLINGSKAHVVGNVCMDMTMVDITGIDANEGDEAIIFGEGLPIQEVAGLIHTIGYEILTNTSERVKRIFTAESI